MSDELAEVLGEIRQKLAAIEGRPNFIPAFLKGDREAAYFCGMKRRAFRQWVEREGVPCKVINGVRYYKLSILERRMTPAEARKEEGFSR